jgi:hypothetical protein
MWKNKEFLDVVEGCTLLFLLLLLTASGYVPCGSGTTIHSTIQSNTCMGITFISALQKVCLFSNRVFTGCL